MQSAEQEFFDNLQWFAIIAALFKKTRFKNLQNEKKLQLEIELMFNLAEVPYNREVKLTDKDIVDFMVGQIAIEVKTKCTGMEMYRQISRYADSDKFMLIILVTNTVTMLPRKINDKYTHVINLGQSWL